MKKDNSYVLYSTDFQLQPYKTVSFLTNSIVSSISFTDVDNKKALEIISEEFSTNTISYHESISEDFNGKKKEHKTHLIYLDNCVYFSLTEDNSNCSVLYTDGASKSTLDSIRKIISSCKKIDGRNKIHLLCSEHGLYLSEFEVKTTDINIEENYNDDLQEVDKLIIDRLNKENDKGIVILHSNPGNGKSHYIRYLTSKVNKKMIYLPPDFSSELSSPNIIPFLMEHPNSVLIIEDAENVIQKRKGGNNQAVSNLLNLSDGLLSDCLNIQIVCTFNSNISEIDEALLRKGRLIAKYDFKPLAKEKAQKLSDKLGHTIKIDKDTPLCEIYNPGDISHVVEEKRISFINKK